MNNKRQIIKIIFLLAVVFISLGISNFASAQEPAKVYFFYGNTCPHCHKAGQFLSELKQKYPLLEIKAYEVFGNKKNANLLGRFLVACGREKIARVPAAFIAGEAVIGFLNNETTGKYIEEKVLECLDKGCADSLKKIEDYECSLNAEKKDEIISLPIIGKVNLSQLSLPVLTITVGALDGFNPCAMWVLVFLLALLMNFRSRKKMLLVGGVFIFVSALFYYLVLAAWLNLFLFLSYVDLTRMIIGFMAVLAGLWQIKNFFESRAGVCKVSQNRWNKKITEKAKKYIYSAALPLTLLGIAALALSVNLVEFFCSAGLPAIYTRILSLSRLHPFAYYLYILLYVFVFMLDDLIILTIAAVTLEKIGFTNKYSRWSALIGGLIIFILGVLLIYAPQFLMFG